MLAVVKHWFGIITYIDDIKRLYESVGDERADRVDNLRP